MTWLAVIKYINDLINRCVIYHTSKQKIKRKKEKVLNREETWSARQGNKMTVQEHSTWTTPT